MWELATEKIPWDTLNAMQVLFLCFKRTISKSDLIKLKLKFLYQFHLSVFFHRRILTFFSMEQ